MALYLTKLDKEASEEIEKKLINFDIIVEKTKRIRKHVSMAKTILKYFNGNFQPYIIVVDNFESLGNSLYSILKNSIELNQKGVRIFLADRFNYFCAESNLRNLLEFEKRRLSRSAGSAKATRERKNSRLGRRKGARVKSIFDKHKSRIKKLHNIGLSKTKIIEKIGEGTPQALGKYIKRLEEERNNKEKRDLNSMHLHKNDGSYGLGGMFN